MKLPISHVDETSFLSIKSRTEEAKCIITGTFFLASILHIPALSDIGWSNAYSPPLSAGPR